MSSFRLPENSRDKDIVELYSLFIDKLNLLDIKPDFVKVKGLASKVDRADHSLRNVQSFFSGNKMVLEQSRELEKVPNSETLSEIQIRNPILYRKTVKYMKIAFAKGVRI